MTVLLMYKAEYFNIHLVVSYLELKGVRGKLMHFSKINLSQRHKGRDH